MDKIYSRPRLVIPKINVSIFNNKYNKISKLKTDKDIIKNNIHNIKTKKKVISLIIIVIVAGLTMNRMLNSINEILEKQCKTQAKSIATKVSNEQATAVMNKYNYNDLFNIIKDNNRKCNNDKCKCGNS